MNKRLQEIRLSVVLNVIDKKFDRKQYRNIINVLSSLALSFGEEYYKVFEDFLGKSINNNMLGASDQEIVASLIEIGYKPTKISKILNLNYQRFQNRYGAYLTEDILEDEHIKNLKPKYDDKYTIMFVTIYRLLTKFSYPIGNEEHELQDHKRSLELEFLLIYNRLTSILSNEAFISRFFFTLCNNIGLDYSTINALKSNIHFINRSFPHFVYNERYLKQEITTLCVSKGLGKGTIGSRIFLKNSNYLYNKSTRCFGIVIKKEDMVWQYITTLDWTNLKVNDVKEFIKIFHELAKFEF